MLVSNADQFSSDETSIQVVARRFHEIHHADVFQVPKNDSEGLEYQAWISGLSSTNAGQKLIDHLSHFEAAPHIKTSSAFEQAQIFRRILMHAFSKSNVPFGIPKKTPKFIALCNLSGDRLLLYSSNPNLITLLATGQMYSSNSTDGVQKIVSNVLSGDENCTAVLFYSLPFQMGVDQTYWECRLLKKGNNGKFDDGELVCSLWDRQASRAASTLSFESQRIDIIEYQLDAFTKNLKACDIDIQSENIDGIQSHESFDEKTSKLKSMISMLQNERRRMIEEHKDEIEEMKKKHVEKTQETLEVTKESFQRQAKDDDKMVEHIRGLESQIRGLESQTEEFKKKISDQDAENRKLNADLMVKEELVESNKRAHTSKTNDIQRELFLLKAQLRRTESENLDALKKQELVHQQMQDQVERKLQIAKQSEVLASKHADHINLVEKAFEGVSNEKTALVADIDMYKNQIQSLRFRLAVQMHKADSFSDMTRKARLDHALCAEELMAEKKTREEHTKQLSYQCQLVDSKNSTILRLEQELSDLRLQLSDSTKTDQQDQQDSSDDTPLDNEPVDTIEYESVSMQTDILPETLKIGELETDNVKLRDEITNLKFELSKLKSRNIKRFSSAAATPQQDDVANVSHHGNGSMTSSHGNVATDTVLENTIQQLHMTLNTVVELARYSKTNESSAREAWSKVHVYEGMNPQQVQPPNAYSMQSYMYMPPQNAQIAIGQPY